MNVLADKIDDFVKGKLPKDEIEYIKELAKSDLELAQAIEDAEIAYIVANELISHDIKNLTNSWKNPGSKTGFIQADEKKSKLNKGVLGLLIGLIILIAISLSVFINNQKSNESLNKELPSEIIDMDDSSEKTIESPSQTEPKESKNDTSKDNEDEKSLKNRRHLYALKIIPSKKSLQVLRSATNIDSNNEYAKILAYYEAKDSKSLNSVLVKQKPNTEIYILVKELLARLYFEQRDNQKAIFVLKELVLSEHPDVDDFEYMLLLCYFVEQTMYKKEFEQLKNKIEKDSDHSYQNSIKKLSSFR